MAAVLFHHSRVRREQMPDLCLRCGRAATETCVKTFSRGQEWTRSFFLGGAPSLVFQWLFRDRFRVEAPLCHSHRNHFLWQSVILWGGLALVATMLAACFALISEVSSEVVSQCFGAAGITALIWLVVLMVNRLTCISPAQINGETALIMGVSDQFAKAYQSGDRVDEAVVQ